MSFFVKKLIPILLSSVFFNQNSTCLDLSTATNEIKISNKIDPQEVVQMFSVPFDMLPFQYRKKVELVLNKFMMGFNVQAASKFSQSLVRKAAEKYGYKFIKVDLSLESSLEKFLNLIDTIDNDTPIFIFIDSIRCADVTSYKDDILEVLKKKNKHYAIFINSIDLCESKKCLNEVRLQDLTKEFEFYDMAIDNKKSSKLDDIELNSRYCAIAKKFLSNLNEYLGGNLDLTDEQINILSSMLGSCKDFSYLEKCFVNMFVSLAPKKTFDFNSILTTMMSYFYVTPDNLGWSKSKTRAGAIHEVSHAFIRKYLNVGDIQIVLLNSDFSGLTLRDADFYINELSNYGTLKTDIMACLAGKVGEDILNGGSEYTFSDDYRKSIKLAHIALTIKDPNFKFKSDSEQDSLISEFLDKLTKDVENIIYEYKEVIYNLADSLAKKEDINGIKFILGSEFDNLYDEFMKNLELKNNFLNDNKDDIDKIIYKVSRDEELWKSVKNVVGINV